MVVNDCQVYITEKDRFNHRLSFLVLVGSSVTHSKFFIASSIWLFSKLSR